jgi:hypothetical protein
MDIEFKEKFLGLWRKYFNRAELPITFYYSDKEGQAELVKPGSVPRCLIGAMVEVRNGRSLGFGTDSVGCFGGKKYLGFAETLRPDFEFFLSCGAPGKMEGERYELYNRTKIPISKMIADTVFLKINSGIFSRTLFPPSVPITTPMVAMRMNCQLEANCDHWAAR